MMPPGDPPSRCLSSLEGTLPARRHVDHRSRRSARGVAQRAEGARARSRQRRHRDAIAPLAVAPGPEGADTRLVAQLRADGLAQRAGAMPVNDDHLTLARGPRLLEEARDERERIACPLPA